MKDEIKPIFVAFLPTYLSIEEVEATKNNLDNIGEQYHVIVVQEGGSFKFECYNVREDITIEELKGIVNGK